MTLTTEISSDRKEMTRSNWTSRIEFLYRLLSAYATNQGWMHPTITKYNEFLASVALSKKTELASMAIPSNEREMDAIRVNPISR